MRGISQKKEGEQEESKRAILSPISMYTYTYTYIHVYIHIYVSYIYIPLIDIIWSLSLLLQRTEH